MTIIGNEMNFLIFISCTFSEIIEITRITSSWRKSRKN